jgi:hypothetical protein
VLALASVVAARASHRVLRFHQQRSYAIASNCYMFVLHKYCTSVLGCRTQYCPTKEGTLKYPAVCEQVIISMAGKALPQQTSDLCYPLRHIHLLGTLSSTLISSLHSTRLFWTSRFRYIWRSSLIEIGARMEINSCIEINILNSLNLIGNLGMEINLISLLVMTALQ